MTEASEQEKKNRELVRVLRETFALVTKRLDREIGPATVFVLEPRTAEESE